MISLVKLEYSPENVTGVTDYLNGNLFAKIKVAITLRVEAFLKPTENAQTFFGDAAFQTRDYIRDEAARFTDFNIGDEIQVADTTVNGGSLNGSYKIIEKPALNIIRVSTTAGAAVDFTGQFVAQDGVIRLVNEPKAISYDYCLPENNEGATYQSKVDGQLMNFFYQHATQIPTSLQTMIPTGKKSWQFDAATGAKVKRLSSDTTLKRYEFYIEQELYIHPFYLAAQREALIAGLPPGYFDLSKCLRHAFRVRSYRSGAEPNIYQELFIDGKKGDTGFTGENFNGKPPVFRFKDIVFDNLIDTLQRDGVTEITIRVDELTAATVKNATLNFILLPEIDETTADETSDYRNIDSYMLDNYCFDRAQVAVGGGTENGYRFGTGYQVFKNVTVTTVGQVATIVAEVEFGAVVKSRIDALDFKDFWITVDCQSDAQVAAQANNVLVDTGLRQIGKDIPEGAVIADISFLRHDVQTIVPGDPFPTVMIEEEMVTNVALSIDTNGFTSIVLDNVRCQMVAKNGSEVAILQDYEVDATVAPIIAGARFIMESSGSGFNTNGTELLSKYRVEREPASDSGTLKAYRLLYPFIFRFEDWEPLFLDTLPADFLDVTQPFNGYNHNWYRLSQLSGWGIYFRLIVRVTADGMITERTFDAVLDPKDYRENPDWILEGIKMYDIDDVELLAGGVPYVSKTGLVKMVATFTTSFGNVDLNKTMMVIAAYPTGSGTHKQGRNSFSSITNREAVSFFHSNGGDGKILLEAPAVDTVTGTTYLDQAKMPTVADFDFSAYIKSPVFLGEPLPFLELQYEGNRDAGYVFAVTNPNPNASIGEFEYEFLNSFVLNYITTDANILTVKFNKNGGVYQTTPPQVYNPGDIIGFLVTFNPGSTTGEIIIET